MELKNFQKIFYAAGSSKAQLMSLTVLLILLLILAELFSFVVIGIQYNNIAQSTVLSRSSTSLVSSLKQSSSQFAEYSAQTALSVLSYYEYNSTLRKDNFITNTSEYLSYLITNGTLPKVTQGSIAANYLNHAMGNMTFQSYNALLLSNFSGSGLYSINESKITISQQNPYYINVSFVENIGISQSGAISQYSLPITASVPINGTPDLYYAQKGILRYINITGLQNLTSLITGEHAVKGNIFAFAYGPVYYATSCPSLTSGTYGTLIFVTPNAISLGTCGNVFAGVITNNTSSIPPSVPYLIYPKSTILSKSFTTGKSVLIYGPQLSALNIEALRQAVANGYFFASPFAPSYLSMSQSAFNSSPAGIATFQGYDQQTASFNGVNAYVSLGNSAKLSPEAGPDGNMTLCTWYKVNSLSGYRGPLLKGASVPSNGNGWEYTLDQAGMFQGFTIWTQGGSNIASYSTGTLPQQDTWYFACFTYNYAAQQSYYYLNGNQFKATFSSGTPATAGTGDLVIGTGESGYSNVSMSNLQIYNISLSANQIKQLYIRGIGGLPIPNNGLVGWWPLDGNTNDYSGQGDKGSPAAAYTLFQPGTPSISPAYLNGATSLINITSLSKSAKVPVSSRGISISAWVKLTAQPGADTGIASTYGGCGYNLFFASSTSLSFSDGCGNSNTISRSFGTNTWYNIIATASTGSPSTVTFYINGTQAGQGSTAAAWSAFSANGLYLGYYAGGSNLNGVLSDVQIYNRTISLAQAKQVYASGPGGAPYNLSVVPAWFKLDGSITDYMQGSTGNAINILFKQINGSARDSIFPNYTGDAYPLPGILSCENFANCYNASRPNLFLSGLPLETGGISQVANFNGSSFATLNTTLQSSSWTVGLWLKQNAKSSSSQYPVGLSGVNGILISGTLENSMWALYDGANTVYGNQLSSNQWYYLAITRSGSTYKLYTDGSASNTATMAAIGINGIQLGRRQDNSLYFNGSMANLQVYSKTLTANQLSSIYSEGISGAPIPNNGIITWIPMDGACIDYSGYSNGCILQQNVSYPVFFGNYLSPGSPSSIENEWQALGFVMLNTSLYESKNYGPQPKAYVPIQLSNQQSTGTSANFQQMISFNPSLSQYSQYEASNLSNIEFTSGAPAGLSGSTPMYAWLESGASTAATNTVAWVNLGSSTLGAAGSGSNTLTIYMNFMSNNAPVTSGYTGYAPQLWCASGCFQTSYAKYDDGAKVFNFYDNFAGTTLNTNLWTVSSGSPTVNDELELSGSTITSKQTFSDTSTALDIYGYFQSPYDGYRGWAFTSGSNSIQIGDLGYYYLINYNPSQYFAGLPPISANTLTIFTLGATSSYSYTSINYGSLTTLSNGYPILNNPNIQLAQTSSTLSYPMFIQWIRTRSYPPNGVMPSFGFGSVS
jgi:hypothetical protein